MGPATTVRRNQHLLIHRAPTLHPGPCLVFLDPAKKGLRYPNLKSKTSLHLQLKHTVSIHFYHCHITPTLISGSSICSADGQSLTNTVGQSHQSTGQYLLLTVFSDHHSSLCCNLAHRSSILLQYCKVCSLTFCH